MQHTGRHIGEWFASRRPAESEHKAYMRWVRAVRELAQIYCAAVPDFDVPTFYAACGMPSTRELSCKQLYSRID